MIITKQDLAVLLITLFAFIGCSYSQGQHSAHDLDYIPGQVMCMFQRNANAESELNELNRQSEYDFALKKRLSQTMNLWLVTYDSDVPVDRVLEMLESTNSVQIAQLNHTNLTQRGIPNDSLFNEQWAFLNDGNNGGAGTSDIDAIGAWDITTGGVNAIGDTIVVAVIDGGFDLDHSDLIQNFYVNHHEIHGNNIDDDGNGYIDDRQGWDFYNDDPYQPNDNHGTHVAGTIGASGNNKIGVTGVNWNVKILPITGSSTLESTVVEAYSYILELRRMYNQTSGEKGAYIVATNSSFGVDEGQPFEYPLWCAMYDSLGMEGVLSAGATANDDVNIDEVGDIPTGCQSNFLITVTNTRSNDELNNNAGFGIVSIDLGAPGTGIYSTLANNNYGNQTGTSMATPHVAGAIGLMYSALCEEEFANYGSNYSELALHMKENLLDEGVDQVNSLVGLIKTGGRLNLRKAIESVSKSCLQISYDTISSSCDSCTGQIVLAVSGSKGTVVFDWNNGSTSDSLFGLCAGVYTVTVSDDSNSIIKQIALSDSGGPIVSVIKSDLTCHDSGDGEIWLSGADNYNWTDGNLNAARSSLEAGEYQVIASNNGSSCSTVRIVKITAPQQLAFSYTSLLPSSEGGDDGSVEVFPSGGVAPYSYDWETGDTTKTIFNEIGNYAITITDANGCELIDTAMIGYPLSEGKERQIPVISVWPNPSNGILNIECSSGIEEIHILDNSGRLIYEDFRLGNDLTVSYELNLASGIYVVTTMSKGHRYFTKLIVTNVIH